MSVTRRKILTLLEETQVGFSNAKTEEAIKEKLIPEGYDDKHSGQAKKKDPGTGKKKPLMLQTNTAYTIIAIAV
jgi:hypothetical protein